MSTLNDYYFVEERRVPGVPITMGAKVADTVNLEYVVEDINGLNVSLYSQKSNYRCVMMAVGLQVVSLCLMHKTTTAFIPESKPRGLWDPPAETRDVILTEVNKLVGVISPVHKEYTNGSRVPQEAVNTSHF